MSGIVVMNSRDDIFESGCDVLVNPVNCVGQMSGGLAAVFKERFPEMNEAYEELCAIGGYTIGHGHSWFDCAGEVTIFTAPTMYLPGSEARLEEVIAALVDLRDFLEVSSEEDCHPSVAIPALGCGVGGLRWVEVLTAMVGVFYTYDGEVKLYPPHGAVGGRNEGIEE